MDLFKLVGSIFIKNGDANSQIESTTRKAETMSQKIGSAFKIAGQKVTNVGKALAPVSAGMATALGASIKSASDFTDGMAKMSTLFDTQKVSVSDLSKEFIALSNKTGLASTELAEAGYQALSAGVSVDKAVGFVETAGNLAKAGFTSTSTAVDVLTTAMNAYGKEAGTADEIANKLVRTQNLGKTTVDELASAMGKVIPTASAMGVNIDNLTSGYVALTKQGIATAEATTYLNSMMNELGDSGTDLGGIIKEKTGMSFQECMKSGMSLADVLKITKEYADENGIAYNELWSSAEAGKAGLSILNEGVEEFNGTVETMASKTDDVSEALAKLETPSRKMQKAFERIKNAGILLGQTIMTAMIPVFEKICNAVEKATTWFGNLDDKTKQNIASFMALIAGISPVLMIFGKLISFIGSVVVGAGKLISIIKTIAIGFKALWAVLMANPVALVIGAVVALIGVFIALWNNCEGFRQFWIDLWEIIKQKTSEVVEAISQFFQKLWENIKVAFESIKASISEAWENIKANISSTLNNIKITVTNGWNRVKSITANVLNAVKSGVSTAWNSIKSIVFKLLNSIKTIVSNGWNAVKSKTVSVMNTVKTSVQTAWNNIKSSMTSILNSIKSTVSTVWNSIKTNITSVMNSVKSVLTSILNSIKSKFSSIWNSIKSTVSGAMGNIKSKINSGMNSAKGTISGVLSSIKSKFSSIWDSATSIVQNAINKIKGFFNFSWSLPHIKLPHFSISGSFSLNPPSIPHFGVSWYKKAMEQPYMFTKPTLFNVNPLTGQAKGAGEAGDEMMYGKKNLMNDIGFVVAQQNTGVIDTMNACFDKLFDILEKYFPEFTREMILDTGVLVAELAPAIDDELGIIQRRKGR
ncbi:MAG: phage tail tape measure protein [Eubacteriales bacterium]|nr:phage tail tape measure protein [Eubacteriales bacterium]